MALRVVVAEFVCQGRDEWVQKQLEGHGITKRVVSLERVPDLSPDDIAALEACGMPVLRVRADFYETHETRAPRVYVQSRDYCFSPVDGLLSWFDALTARGFSEKYQQGVGLVVRRVVGPQCENESP